MTILYDDGTEPFKHPVPYDPQNKMYYSRTYRPNTWLADTEYIEEANVVIPTVPNGFAYECLSGGISAATEPAFTAVTGKVTVDGSVKWQAVPYTLLLLTGDTVTDSTWIGTNSEVIDNEAIIDSIQTKFRLTAVDVDAESVTIVNHITVLRANGDTEEFDRTLIIKVKNT